MTRPIMSTGTIQFSGSEQHKPQKENAEAPMHIALLGDFSGRESRCVNDAENLSSRAIIEIDRDNFYDVFESLKVSLQLPIALDPVPFTEFEDLHPDFLVQKLDVFEELRVLQRQIKTPELLEQTIKEIHQWQTENDIKHIPPIEDREKASFVDTPEVILTDDMLDEVFNQTRQALLDRPNTGSISTLIKDIVAPYTEPKEDLRVAQMEVVIENAISGLLRKILHASEFQSLEASWLSVFTLVRRIETNSRLKLFLIDVSETEIFSDITQHAQELEKSQLYKLLVEPATVSGAIPFSMINADYFVGKQPESCRIAEALSAFASKINANLVMGASTAVAGCENIYAKTDPDDWKGAVDADLMQAWNNLRSGVGASYLTLVAPRFLTRLPYGEKTQPIDSFKFEELTENNLHKYYAWGNSAYLAVLLAAESYSRSGINKFSGALEQGQTKLLGDNCIANMPLHIYSRAGESQIKPCAEFLMIDRVADKLKSVGISPVLSVKNNDSILLPEIISVQSNVD